MKWKHPGTRYLPALALAWGACSSEGLTDGEREIVTRLSPLPDLPADPTNAHADDPGAAELGQRLFFETAWTGELTESPVLEDGGPRELSCASCHARDAYDDPSGRNVTLGADWHERNAPPLVNATFYEWGGWSGRFDSQWSTPLVVFESPKVFNSTRLKVVHTVFDKHRAKYEAVFDSLEPAIGSDAVRFPENGKPKATGEPDGAWEDMTTEDRAIVNQVFVNVGKALAAYCRLLVSRDAPFDRFVAGDSTAITQAAQRGLKLFIGEAGCVSCHKTPQFSDDEFHNLAIPQIGEPDKGRWAVLEPEKDPLRTSKWNGAGEFSDDPVAGAERLAELEGLTEQETLGTFRTKGLRQIALTAPYMHAGQFATLREVVESYNHGHEDTAPVGNKDPAIRPLNLTDDEVSDLVEFLGSLTGEPLDSELTEDPASP